MKKLLYYFLSLSPCARVCLVCGFVSLGYKTHVIHFLNVTASSPLCASFNRHELTEGLPQTEIEQMMTGDHPVSLFLPREEPQNREVLG